MDVHFGSHKLGDDPFAEDPLPPAHYYPSIHKQLTAEQKQLKLSRHTQHSRNTTSNAKAADSNKHLSPNERKFLHPSNTMLAKELPTHDTPSPRDTSSKFDESWPASERPSTIESPSDISLTSAKLSSLHLRDRLNMLGIATSLSSAVGSDEISRDVNHWRASLQPQKGSPSKESTLAKYIHRFRYSEPKSREQRAKEKVTSQQKTEFWWMSSSSPPTHSSTPTTPPPWKNGTVSSSLSQRSPLRMNGPGRVLSQRSNVGRGGSGLSSTTSQMSTSSPSSSALLLDEATRQLQAKADKLLQKSESTLLSEPAVSSEGVGLSPSTTTDDSMYMHRIPDRTTDNHHVHLMTETPSRSVRPEDDILYQWRVRRRLEQARQPPQGQGWNLAESQGFTSEQIREPSDANSRLEEFRRRLKHQEILAKSHQNTTTTDLPLGGTTTDFVCHAGTDPIPQSISTQTNGALPSGGDLRYDPRPQGHRVHPDVQLGLEHDLPVKDTGDGSGVENASQDASSRHLVASPHIERTGAPSIVKPHLHLECDIIPCGQTMPHVHRESVDGDLEHIVMEANRPANEVRNSSGTFPPTSQNKHVRIRRGRNEQNHELIRRHNGRLDSVMPSSVDAADRHGNASSHGFHHGHPRQKLDFDDDADNDGTLVSQQKKVIIGGVEGQKVMGQRSSTPVRSAIGQVISSRLFASTPTPQDPSPCSSVDSLPSMQHLPSTQTSSEDNKFNQNDEKDSISSDGEFEDDELLQMLRRRRAQFEQQLLQLDQMIQDTQP